MEKVFYEWDSDESDYLFWKEGEKDAAWHVSEEQFNNVVERFERNGKTVEEYEG
jgi:hypothetical protein